MKDEEREMVWSSGDDDRCVAEGREFLYPMLKRPASTPLM